MILLGGGGVFVQAAPDNTNPENSIIVRLTRTREYNNGN